MLFDDIFSTYWDDGKFAINAKERRTKELVLYMLNRTQQIFKWDGLPETIPAHNLEFMLQTNGNICITEVSEVPEGRGDRGLYAFWGGLGGMLNAYYEPTIYTIANPYLEFTKELLIGRDCIRARNDKNGIGLIPLFLKYASMQNENEISLNMLAINYRIDNLISADNDRTFESAKDFLNDIVAGKFGAISSNEFFEGIRNDKTGGSNKSIKDLIEYEQYIKASWFNEIGLNSNFNMKRERLTEAETQLTDDSLIPLVDNMLDWRQKAIDEVKELYGDRYDLDGLKVSLNPIWDLDQMYIDMLPEDISERSEVSEDEGENEDENNSNSLSNGFDNISDDSGYPDNDGERGEQTEEETPDETDETDGTEETDETDETDETPENSDTSEDIEDIKEDIEEIKEDIEDIKEGVENEENETN